ncbi:hypothetical protein BJ878DRAFT_246771 [Calycina marina]|uniref:ABM domain-containing protein n=1 Tax=Calycina marina TaxID=1763456 RepID=A0A9P7YW87_9HELO|nr:hypothetical protein BJ878DRAFT_246771 [Calycina marina]
MASPVTEITTVTLKPNIDLEAPGPWLDTLATIASQDGYIGLQYGRQLEEPDMLMLLIDWTSLAKHQQFIDSPIYGDFVKRFGAILTDIQIYHVETTPFPPAILTKSPCIEFATFYNIEPGFLENLGKFASVLDEAKPKEFYGGALGPVVGEITQPKEGATAGNAAVLFFGWESREAHAAFRNTELFANNIFLLREKLGGAKVFHVAFEEYLSK